MTDWSAMSSNDYAFVIGNAILDLRFECECQGLGFELCYEEASDTWYARIVSSPEERFIGKSRREVGHALGDVLNWISTRRKEKNDGDS